MLSYLNQIINIKEKKPILYDAIYNKNSIKKPVIILCHGYMGFKDWGAWGLVGEEFSKNNYFFHLNLNLYFFFIRYIITTICLRNT